MVILLAGASPLLLHDLNSDARISNGKNCYHISELYKCDMRRPVGRLREVTVHLVSRLTLGRLLMLVGAVRALAQGRGGVRPCDGK